MPPCAIFSFFFNDTATTEIYTLSLHDALPILLDKEFMDRVLKIIERQMDNADFTINEFCSELAMSRSSVYHKLKTLTGNGPKIGRAHVELQSRQYLVCRLLLEKKKEFTSYRLL